MCDYEAALNAQEKVQAAAQAEYLRQQQQQIADEKAQVKTNLTAVLDGAITSKYANQNGRIFDASTGKDFVNAKDFFAAAGVSGPAAAAAAAGCRQPGLGARPSGGRLLRGPALPFQHALALVGQRAPIASLERHRADSLWANRALPGHRHGAELVGAGGGRGGA